KKINVKFTFIGRNRSTSIFDDLSVFERYDADFVRFLGDVSYEKMYSLLEESDYLITTLNPIQHKKYLESVVTGNLGLTYGFQKPMLIQKEFAKHYDIADKAIVYEDERDLHEAILRAINLSDSEYKEIQNKLETSKDKLFGQSLNNLKEVLDRIII
ncbi:MAG: hypothetical protein LBH46_04190, partial [Rickettsiales bacterium]|nr:hypothetical protein [Rickettsiales bacterium]